MGADEPVRDCEGEGATPEQVNAFISPLYGDYEFSNYGNGDPAAGWAIYQKQAAARAADAAAQQAAGVGFGPPDSYSTTPGGNNPPPGGGGNVPPPVGGGGGGGGGAGGGGNATSPTDFYSTLPNATRTFNGFPAGTGNQALLPGYGSTQQLNNFARGPRAQPAHLRRIVGGNPPRACQPSRRTRLLA